MTGFSFVFQIRLAGQEVLGDGEPSANVLRCVCEVLLAHTLISRQDTARAVLV